MAVFSGPRMITNGLVFYLDAINIKSYPNSGATWTDLSGNQNNFTLNNTPTFSNNIFTFNGTNQTASSTNVLPLQICNTDFTIRFLFKTNSTNSNDGMILYGTGGGFNTGGKGVELRKRSTNNLEFGINDGVGAGIRTTVTGNYTNAWTDLCVTFLKSTESKYYVNGVFGQTTSYAGETNITDTFTFNIGRGNDSFFPGDIALVCLYNRVLSAAEIQQNFNALKGRYNL
jgi:hypothetical protein